MKVVKLEFLQEMKAYLKEKDTGILEDVDSLLKEQDKVAFNDLNFQKDLYSLKLLMHQVFFEHDKKVEYWQDSFNTKRYQLTVKCRDFDYRLAHNATKAGYWSQKDKHALFVHESGKDYVVRVDLLTNTCKTYKLSEVVPAAAEEVNAAVMAYDKYDVHYWHIVQINKMLDSVFKLDEYNPGLFYEFLHFLAKI